MSKSLEERIDALESTYQSEISKLKRENEELRLQLGAEPKRITHEEREDKMKQLRDFSRAKRNPGKYLWHFYMAPQGFRDSQGKPQRYKNPIRFRSLHKNKEAAIAEYNVRYSTNLEPSDVQAHPDGFEPEGVVRQNIPVELSTMGEAI